jgi:hypothetical protein
MRMEARGRAELRSRHEARGTQPQLLVPRRLRDEVGSVGPGDRSRESRSEPLPGRRRDTTTPRLVAPCVAVALVAACSATGDRAVPVTVRDSAGVEVTEFTRALREGLPRWSLVLESDLGSDEAAEEEQFFRVTDVRRDRRGRLAVLNAGTGQVRFFNSNGEFDRVLGRKGNGPGEFQAPLRIEALDEDTIVVFDADLRRLSLIGPEGGVGRTITLPGELNYVRLVGILPNGDFVLSSEAIQAPAGRKPSVDHARILRLNRQGRQVGEIGVYRTRRWVRLDGNSITKPEFDPVTSFGVVDSLVWVAEGDGYEVRFYDATGAFRRVTRWVGPDRTVTEADRDRWSQEQMRWAQTAEDRASIKQQLARTVYADERAAYDMVVGNQSGRLWIRDFDPWAREYRTWLVLDEDGRPDGVVTTPISLEVMEIAEDWVAGVSRDSLDVSHVVTYRIAPTRGGGNGS